MNFSYYRRFLKKFPLFSNQSGMSLLESVITLGIISISTYSFINQASWNTQMQKKAYTTSDLQSLRQFFRTFLDCNNTMGVSPAGCTTNQPIHIYNAANQIIASSDGTTKYDKYYTKATCDKDLISFWYATASDGPWNSLFNNIPMFCNASAGPTTTTTTTGTTGTSSSSSSSTTSGGGSGMCGTCPLLAGHPNLTMSDGINNFTLIWNSVTEQWEVTESNVMGSMAGLPEWYIVWGFKCDGDNALMSSVPSNSFNCNPLSATFGPYTGFDGMGPYTLTVSGGSGTTGGTSTTGSTGSTSTGSTSATTGASGSTTGGPCPVTMAPMASEYYSWTPATGTEPINTRLGTNLGLAYPTIGTGPHPVISWTRTSGPADPVGTMSDFTLPVAGTYVMSITANYSDPSVPITCSVTTPMTMTAAGSSTTGSTTGTTGSTTTGTTSGTSGSTSGTTTSGTTGSTTGTTTGPGCNPADPAKLVMHQNSTTIMECALNRKVQNNDWVLEKVSSCLYRGSNKDGVCTPSSPTCFEFSCSGLPSGTGNLKIWCNSNCSGAPSWTGPANSWDMNGIASDTALAHAVQTSGISPCADLNNFHLNIDKPTCSGAGDCCPAPSKVIQAEDNLGSTMNMSWDGNALGGIGAWTYTGSFSGSPADAQWYLMCKPGQLSQSWSSGTLNYNFDTRVYATDASGTLAASCNPPKLKFLGGTAKPWDGLTPTIVYTIDPPATTSGGTTGGVTTSGSTGGSCCSVDPNKLNIFDGTNNQQAQLVGSHQWGITGMMSVLGCGPVNYLTFVCDASGNYVLALGGGTTLADNQGGVVTNANTSCSTFQWSGSIKGCNGNTYTATVTEVASATTGGSTTSGTTGGSTTSGTTSTSTTTTGGTTSSSTTGGPMITSMCCGATQIPANLTGKISAPGCPDIDGQQIPLTIHIPGTRFEGTVGTTRFIMGDATMMGLPYCPIQVIYSTGNIGPLSSGIVCSPFKNTLNTICGGQAAQLIVE